MQRISGQMAADGKTHLCWYYDYPGGHQEHPEERGKPMILNPLAPHANCHCKSVRLVNTALLLYSYG